MLARPDRVCQLLTQLNARVVAQRKRCVKRRWCHAARAHMYRVVATNWLGHVTYAIDPGTERTFADALVAPKLLLPWPTSPTGPTRSPARPAATSTTTRPRRRRDPGVPAGAGGDLRRSSAHRTTGRAGATRSPPINLGIGSSWHRTVITAVCTSPSKHSIKRRAWVRRCTAT